MGGCLAGCVLVCQDVDLRFPDFFPDMSIADNREPRKFDGGSSPPRDKRRRESSRSPPPRSRDGDRERPRSLFSDAPTKSLPTSLPPGGLLSINLCRVL